MRGLNPHPYLPVWGSAPDPVFLSLFQFTICYLKIREMKTKNIERPISPWSIHTYKFCIFKVQNWYKKIQKWIIAWSTYLLNKLVCKNWCQAGDELGKQKHLNADIPINAILSKSKIAIKNDILKKKQLLHDVLTN